MTHKPLPNPRPRRLTPCHRHPHISIATTTPTGLCAPCLRERLCLLNPSSSSSSTATPPELRRCKTFSANNSAGVSFEPRRRSCDVGARDSLSSLFHLDDGCAAASVKVESRNLGILSEGTCPVLEVEEEELDEDERDSCFEEARVSDFPDNVDDFEDSMTMKEFIDLEFQTRSRKPSSNKKDFREIAGSFLIAATSIGNKLRKWRKREGNGGERIDCNGDGFGAGLGDMRLENLKGRRLRESLSEVGEYGLGRRSCDVDPRVSIELGRASIDNAAFGIGRMSCDTDSRFSIDLGRGSVDCGRVSVDEGRCSFDVPRASWDGYLVGGRALPCRGGGGGVNVAPVVSVIENAMATIYGFDNRVLAEGKANIENGDLRDELDVASMVRHKKGLDASNSIRRDTLVTEDAEAKSLSNAKVSPAAIGIFNGTKLLITEKELNEWRLNSVKDDSSESFETASKDLASVSSCSNGNSFKKCRQWSKLWSVWGLLHRKKGEKCGDEEKVGRGTHAGFSSARNSNVEAGSDPDRRLVRSHSVASSRGSLSVVESGRGTVSRNDSKAIVRSRQQDGVLERNRSAKFSPNHLDNGLLRFYLTPLKGRRRSKVGKSRLKNSPFLARSVIR